MATHSLGDGSAAPALSADEVEREWAGTQLATTSSVTVTAVAVPEPRADEHAAKKPRKGANKCSECGAVDKFSDQAKHTKSGWCSCEQRFAGGSKAERRLRTLERLLADKDHADEELRRVDEDAHTFLEALKNGNFRDVRRLLKEREELILMPVWSGPLYGKSAGDLLWKWSVLHEAVSHIEPNDDCKTSTRIKTLEELLDSCQKLQVDVDRSLPKMTRSNATVAHQAAFRGNEYVMEKLIETGVDLFAKTVSDWLPLHNALKFDAPAYKSGQQHSSRFAKYLLGRMREQCEREQRNMGATTPEACERWRAFVDFLKQSKGPKGFTHETERRGDLDALKQLVAAVGGHDDA